MRRFTRVVLSGALAMLLALVCAVGIAGAHTSVTQAVPEPGSRMDAPPKSVELSFNERIEPNLFYIKVINSSGHSVTNAKAVLDETHTHLTLPLPKLANDYYIVSYHIISADGHPVESSYVITVGPPGSQKDAMAGHDMNSGVMAGMDMPGMAHSGLSWNMGFTGMVKQLIRILYYLTLLSTAGWALWSAAFRGRTGAEMEKQSAWLLNLMRLHMLALLLYIFNQFPDLLGEQAGLPEVVALLTGTTIGIAWLVSLGLALAGFLLTRSGRLLPVWAGLLLAAKSVNGHAMAFDPRAATLALDWVHLLAAAVWTGGLLMIAANWKNKEFRDALLPRFSRAALISILVLIATGVLSTLLFLPKISYVLYTQWGTVLLVKTGLVALVVVVGALLRYFMKRRKEKETAAFVKIDLTLAAAILAVVGILTFLAPLPANQPFNWHQMGQNVHMTVRITPNVPGVNDFIAKVWLPESLGKPKQVQLKLINTDDKSIPPIDVPVMEYQDNEVDVSFGLVRYSYKASGPYLALAGGWKVQMRVLDSNDNETVYEKEMRVY